MRLPLTPEAWVVVAVLAGSLVLFASERVRPDVVALLALLALALSGVIDVGTAFAGFSSPAVITVAAMFVLSAGTVDAGLPAAIANVVARMGGTRLVPIAVLLMLIVGAMSAFMNNIAATVILIPAAVSLARSAGTQASKFLMPLAFGSLLGGLTTQIGTPPNLLAGEALAAAGLRPFGMFDYAPTGLILLGVGLIYFALIGVRMLPLRAGADREREAEQVREYLTELLVPNDSDIAGSSLRELRWRPRYEVSVAEIIREDRRNRFPSEHDQIFIGDRLLVHGERDAVIRLVADARLEFAAEREARQTLVDDEEATVVELVAGPAFERHDQTVVGVGFRWRYGGLVLGIWRQGRRVRQPLRHVRIRPGDVLLVRMPWARVQSVADADQFIVLGQRPRSHSRPPRMAAALGILALTVALAATGVAHIAVTATLGVVLMLGGRVISYRRLYEVVEWRTLVVIGGMIPVGRAMESSGLAGNVAELVSNTLQPFGPLAVLAGLFVLTTLLTEVMSNAGAVVLMAPIALGIAAHLGISPHAAMMMIAIAASTAFLSPFGHQADILVYNAAGYRYFDFTRIGGPLTLLTLLVSLLVVPLIWPL